jgi:uncharacterized protein YcnI
VLAILAVAAPAAAHVTVSAKPAQASAIDAVLSFHAAAESRTAGTTALQVQLPDGITPAQVSYVGGPPGWTLATTTDGYTVSGPALPPGQAAEYQIRVTKLPDASTVAFKTVQTYSDGKVDRWIELPPASGSEPEHPAPTLALAPAVASTSAAPTGVVSPWPDSAPASPPVITPTTADGDGSDTGDGSLLVWTLVGAVMVIAAVAVAAVVLSRSRRRRP